MPELQEAPQEVLAALDAVLEKDTSVPILSPAESAVVLTEEKKEETTPPPAAEKKTDVLVKRDEDYEPPEVLPNEGRKDVWGKMREEYAQRKTALKESRAEIEKLKADIAGFDGTRKELEGLKTQLKELQDLNSELSKIDSVSKLENMPEFKRKYDQAELASIDRLKTLAGHAEVSADDLVKTLSMSVKDRYQQLDDILSGVPQTLRQRVINEIEKVETLREDRAKELQDAAANLRSLHEQRTVAERTAMENESKTREAVFDQVYARVSKDGTLDDAVLKEAREFFLNNDNLERAVEIVIDAKRHKLSGSKEKELSAKVAELEKQIKDYQGATASIDSGRTVTSKDDQRPDEDFTAYMVRRARELSQGA